MMSNPGHPAAALLEAFVAGDTLSARDRMHVDEHVSGCTECGAWVAFRRAVAETAARLPDGFAPPPGALIDRALASRAAGVRTVLPTEDPPSSLVRRRRLWLAAASIIGLAGVASLLSHRIPASHSATGGARTTPVEEEFTSPFAPRSAYAEVAHAGSNTGVPAISGIDGTRLRAGQYRIARRWVHPDGRVESNGVLTVRVSRDTAAGGPAWRLEQRAEGGVGESGQRDERETMLMARHTLKPISRAITNTPYLRYDRIDVTQRFIGDSVLGRMIAHGADATGVGRPIAQRLPPDFAPFVDDGALTVFFGALPLRSGWTGAFSILGWAVRPQDVLHRARARVIGTERVTVPAGTWDCWRLLLTTAHQEVDVWVRTSDGVIVRSRDRIAGPHGLRENLLLGQ